MPGATLDGGARVPGTRYQPDPVSAALATAVLGGGRAEVLAALSNAWLDGGALRSCRHAPNTGSRKSWAAPDATSRGVWLALMCLRGEMAYPSALTAPG